jgi:hypothetical protein
MRARGQRLRACSEKEGERTFLARCRLQLPAERSAPPLHFGERMRQLDELPDHILLSSTAAVS